MRHSSISSGPIQTPQDKTLLNDDTLVEEPSAGSKSVSFRNAKSIDVNSETIIPTNRPSALMRQPSNGSIRNGNRLNSDASSSIGE